MKKSISFILILLFILSGCSNNSEGQISNHEINLDDIFVSDFHNIDVSNFNTKSFDYDSFNSYEEAITFFEDHYNINNTGVYKKTHEYTNSKTIDGKSELYYIVGEENINYVFYREFNTSQDQGYDLYEVRDSQLVYSNSELNGEPISSENSFSKFSIYGFDNSDLQLDLALEGSNDLDNITEDKHSFTYNYSEQLSFIISKDGTQYSVLQKTTSDSELNNEILMILA